MKPALGSAIVANGLSAPLGQSVHVGAALVGMGAIFGGISTPALVKHIKAPVLIQGRQHRALYLTQTLSTSDKPPLGLSSAFTPLPSPSTAGSPSVFELADGSAFSFKSFIEKTSRRTSQIMNGQRKSGRRESKARAAAENSDDDGDLASPCLEIGHSTARLFSSERNSQSILKSHYFYSEMQFIMTLIEISDRLRSVPKSARQRSLVAELTLLNHNLPADVCIPFFCNNGVSNNRGHHKMMRIVLSDCVVLNSADRVPYLIIVEVIEPRKNDERASDSPVSVTSPTLSGKLPPKLETSVNSKCDVPKQQVTSEVAVNNVATEKDAIEIENLDAENGIDVHDSKGLPPNTSDDLASPKVNFVELSSVEDADNIVVGPEIVTGEAESPLGEECHPQVKGYDNILNENVVNTFTAPVYDFEAPSESEPRLSSEKLRVSSVMHHHTVMSRRKASFDNLGIQPETTELGRLPMGRLSISITSNHDNTFAEKMRTAAVMLAQIHQQQQKQETSDIRDKKTTTAAKDNIDDIRTKVIKEMEALEVKRLLSPMPLEGLNVDLTDLEESLVRNRNRSVSEDVDHDDPSGNGLANLAIVFRESWSVKEERVRNASPYGSEPGWKLLSFIVKSGADLRQEQLALQLIREMHKIWEIENVPVRIHNFRILVISHQSGLIETIPDAVSIHSIKRDGLQRQELPGMPYTLYDHFIKVFLA